MPESMGVRSSTNHYLVAALLGSIGVIILLVFISIRSQADTTNSSATVSNATPTVDTVTVATTDGGAAISALNLTEGGSSTSTAVWVYVHGTFHDDNGCSQVTSTPNKSVSIGLARNGVTCQTSGQISESNCYIANELGTDASYDTSCSFTNCDSATDTTGSYSCNIPVYNFIDATGAGAAPDYSAQAWAAGVLVFDNSYATSSVLSSDTFEVNSLSAINVTGNVDYGSLAVSAVSATSTIVVYNTGNDNGTDATVAGSALTCTVGTISVGQQSYTTSSQIFTYAQALTGSGVNIRLNANAGVLKQTVSTTAMSSSTYWKLTMPSSGLSGNCTGSLTFTAS